MHMSIGQKINQFENAPEQTVSTFNDIFKDCQLLNFPQDAEVEIGEIIGPDLVRAIFVGGVKIKHTFVQEFIIPLDMPFDLRSVVMRKDNMLVTNEELENLEMTEEEMKLDPYEYIVLQYLRGCQSPYHTQLEMAKKLNKSARGLRTVLKRLESKKIIETKNIVNHQRIHIRITEDWA
jgi:hypothetical protein